ncbi:hypothetical protein GCM10020001_108540 [Nonomuraea salmonea]
MADDVDPEGAMRALGGPQLHAAPYVLLGVGPVARPAVEPPYKLIILTGQMRIEIVQAQRRKGDDTVGQR